VQVVYSSRLGSREIEYIGPVHDEAELEALKAAARQRMMAGQLELDCRQGIGVAAGARLPLKLRHFAVRSRCARSGVT
jgi:hypothetical protein